MFSESNTWEPITNLSKAALQLVKEFQAQRSAEQVQNSGPRQTAPNHKKPPSPKQVVCICSVNHPEASNFIYLNDYRLPALITQRRLFKELKDSQKSLENFSLESNGRTILKLNSFLPAL